MAAKKYLVFNVEELKKLLPPETLEYVKNLAGWVDQARAQAAEADWEKAVQSEQVKAVKEQREPKQIPKPTTEPPLYFVLNMKDKYALGTLEHYLEEIDNDHESRHVTGVKEAAAAARDVRNRAKFLDTKLPD